MKISTATGQEYWVDQSKVRCRIHNNLAARGDGREGVEHFWEGKQKVNEATQTDSKYFHNMVGESEVM